MRNFLKATRNLFISLAFAIPLLSGCGGTDIPMDGGPPPPPPQVQCNLQTGNYVVTNVSDPVDGCGLNPSDLPAGKPFQLSADGDCNIEIMGIGKGQIVGGTGSLVLEGDSNVESCSFHYNSQLDVTVTGDNQLIGKFAEMETDRSPTCVPVSDATCTSTWTLSLQLQ